MRCVIGLLLILVFLRWTLHDITNKKGTKETVFNLLLFVIGVLFIVVSVIEKVLLMI